MYRALIITTFILFNSFPVFPQNNQTAGSSQKIKSAFARQYPGSTEVIWTFLEKIAVVSFKSGDSYKEAFYSKEGDWLKTETEIEPGALPFAVKKVIDSEEFNEWHKGSTFLLELPGNKKRYKVYMYSADWQELGLIFNEKGQRLADKF
jgi:hypothetical protein